jgi:hypothetical protein
MHLVVSGFALALDMGSEYPYDELIISKGEYNGE